MHRQRRVLSDVYLAFFCAAANRVLKKETMKADTPLRVEKKRRKVWWKVRRISGRAVSPRCKVYSRQRSSPKKPSGSSQYNIIRMWRTNQLMHWRLIGRCVYYFIGHDHGATTISLVLQASQRNHSESGEDEVTGRNSLRVISLAPPRRWIIEKKRGGRV